MLYEYKYLVLVNIELVTIHGSFYLIHIVVKTGFICINLIALLEGQCNKNKFSKWLTLDGKK